MTKQCFKCKQALPLTMFYKHSKMADGRVNKCKECNKKDVRENREKNIDYYLEYDRNRANIPKRINARALYAQTEEGKAAAKRSAKQYMQTEKGKAVVKLAKIKWTELNLLKKSASTIVGNAVRDGKLLKPNSCSECGKTSIRIHGHHDDYAYPMTVRWLCSKCHCAWHKINGSAING